MAVVTEAPGLEGLISLVTTLRSLAQWTFETAQAFENAVLRTDDTVMDVRNTTNRAKNIITDLAAHCRIATDVITCVDWSTPHPPYIHNLNEDILSEIFGTAEQEERRFYTFLSQVDQGPHLPELAMAVGRH